MRHNNRAKNIIRELNFNTKFLKTIPYSVLVETGNTRILSCASLDNFLPNWLRGKGKGWISAEYSMLPKSSNERIKRERKSLAGRTQEIQRLIGRSLRAVVDLYKLGERQILIDCDVIEADGGTRCASINGAFVALSLLVKDLMRNKIILENPILENVCAISAGILNNDYYLDLDYNEDSNAQVDANIVMTSSLKLVEIQSTAEEDTFSKEQLIKLIELAERTIPSIVEKQNNVINS
jgi:ribonuclease PH